MPSCVHTAQSVQADCGATTRCTHGAHPRHGCDPCSSGGASVQLKQQQQQRYRRSCTSLRHGYHCADECEGQGTWQWLRRCGRCPSAHRPRRRAASCVVDSTLQSRRRHNNNNTGVVPFLVALTTVVLYTAIALALQASTVNAAAGSTLLPGNRAYQRAMHLMQQGMCGAGVKQFLLLLLSSLFHHIVCCSHCPVCVCRNVQMSMTERLACLSKS